MSNIKEPEGINYNPSGTIATLVTKFYEAVGQHIMPWQAPPPKPIKEVIT